MAREILEKVGEGSRRAGGLLVPPIAMLELVLVLLSEGRGAGEVEKVVELVRDVAERYGIGLAEFSLGQLIAGLSVYKSSKIGLFDSLIAGAALDMKTPVLADDPDFEIAGLERLTFREYLEDLKKR